MARRRSKIRCINCGRRGGVVTTMLDWAEHDPSWKWGSCFVPRRECRRCKFAWRDDAAETMLDEHRRKVGVHRG